MRLQTTSQRFLVQKFNNNNEKNIAFGTSKSDVLRALLNEDKKQAQPLVLGIRASLIKGIDSLVQKPVIAIGLGGESASGKTTLTQRLVSAIKGENSVSYVVGDLYFKDQSAKIKSAGGFEKFLASGGSFDTPQAINLKLLSEHISALKAGKPIKSPEYVKDGTGRSIPDVHPVSPSSVIVSDGVFNLHPQVVGVFDIAGYVKSPANVIKQRWINRTGNENPFHLKELSEKAETHVQPTQNFANIIFNGQASVEHTQSFLSQLFKIVKGEKI